MKYQIENILKPISAESPCGSDLSSETDYYVLEELSMPKEETQFSEAEPVEWNKVETLALELLSKSKDLWIIHYFTSAISHLYRISGFLDSLNIIYETLSNYWENLFPSLEIDEDDPCLERVNILKTIFSRNSALHHSIYEISISDSKPLGTFTYRDYLIITDRCKDENNLKGNCTRQLIEAALKESSEEFRDALESNLISSINRIGKIKSFLTDQSLLDAELEKSLNNSINLLEDIKVETSVIITESENNLDEKNNTEPEHHTPSETISELNITKSKLSAHANQNIVGYADIIRMLHQIYQWYENNEPASPVPLFLKRGENLIGKDFMTILSDVAAPATQTAASLFKLALPTDDSSCSNVDRRSDHINNPAVNQVNDRPAGNTRYEEEHESGINSSYPNADFGNFSQMPQYDHNNFDY